MNDNDIIKALECCIKTQCENCCNLGSWHEQWNCMTDIMKKALDLINRLRAEIERLSDRNRKCIYLSDDETTEYCVNAICPKFKTAGQIRAEAIKEFAERLKKEVLFDSGWGVMQPDVIDNLVKEMTEGTE